MFWLQMCYWGTCSGGKVVAWPTDASHWINMKLALQELSSRGHSVTVLMPSSSFMIKQEKMPSGTFNFEVVPVQFTREQVQATIDKFLKVWIYEVPNLSFWEATLKIKELLGTLTEMSRQLCDGMVRNVTLLEKLRREAFDVVLSDPLSLCGELVAELLGIPFIYTFRFSEGNSMERLCGSLPAPPSYVPASTGSRMDKMAFAERLKNFMFYLIKDLFFLYFVAYEWDEYYSEVLGKSC